MIGLPARSTETLQTSLSPHEVRMAVEQTLGDIRWKYDEPEEGLFRASVSVSLSSFGETFSIKTRQRGVIEIESRCKWPSQIIDWGKNKANIREFLARFQSNLEEYTREKTAANARFEADGDSRIERIINDES